MNNTLMKRMQKAAGRFSNYSGSEGAPGAPTPANRMGKFNRTITLKVVNATNEDADYVLFGYNENGDAQNAGSDTGITITCTQSSHAQVKRESANGGYVILACKLRSTDAAQFAEDIVYRLKSATSRLVEDSITPDQYNEPENNQTTFLRIDDFEGMEIDGEASIKGTLLEGVTLTFIFTLQSKVRLINAAKDQSVVQSNNAPAPNGLAPIRIETAPARR